MTALSSRIDALTEQFSAFRTLAAPSTGVMGNVLGGAAVAPVSTGPQSLAGFDPFGAAYQAALTAVSPAPQATVEVSLPTGVATLAPSARPAGLTPVAFRGAEPIASSAVAAPGSAGVGAAVAETALSQLASRTSSTPPPLA